MFTTKATRPDAFRELGLAVAGFYLHLNGEKDDDGIITTADGLFKALGGPEKERRALISSGDVLAFSDGTLVIRDHLKANKNLFGTIYYTPSASPHRAELYVMADYSYTLNPRLGRPLTSLKRQDMLSHSLQGAPQICDEPDPFPDDAPPEYAPEQPEQKREPEKITTTTESNLTEPNLTEPKDKDGRRRKQPDTTKKTPSIPSTGDEPPQANADENGVIDDTDLAVSPDFAAFWEVYPRKIGIGACWKWWQAHEPSAQLLEKMIAVVKVMSQTEQWQKDDHRFAPLPKTWLGQSRWADPVPSGLSSAGPGADFDAFWNGVEEEDKPVAEEVAREQGFKTPKEWHSNAIKNGQDIDFLKEDLAKKDYENFLLEAFGRGVMTRKDFLRPSDLVNKTAIKRIEYKENTWITIYEESRKKGISMHRICKERGLDYDTLFK